MNNIKTTITSYYFNISNADEKTAYKALCEKLTANGLKVFYAWGGKGSYYYSEWREGTQIELETKHIFDNQWNTAPIEGVSEIGLRVFDWAEDYLPNKSIKCGHYLDITPEIKELRDNTLSCKYCGKQSLKTEASPEFCPHCIGSEYLTEKDLFLTRLAPVSFKGDRKPLTDEELAILKPKYINAQSHGNTERDKARLAKQRTDMLAKRNQAIKKATIEYDGLTWLLDHGIKIDNCIYYDHINRFSFGWRSPVSDSVKNAILEVVSEFPFNYEIKCEDGKTLLN